MMLRMARPTSLAGAVVVVAIAAAGAFVAANAGSAIIIYVPYATVGALIVIKRPRSVIGWLLTTTAWAFALDRRPLHAGTR